LADREVRRIGKRIALNGRVGFGKPHPPRATTTRLPVCAMYSTWRLKRA
jgi:hypothetical protein